MPATGTANGETPCQTGTPVPQNPWPVRRPQTHDCANLILAPQFGWSRVWSTYRGSASLDAGTALTTGNSAYPSHHGPLIGPPRPCPPGQTSAALVALDDKPSPWVLIRDHHVVSKRRDTILVASQPYGDAAARQRSAHRSPTTNQTPCVPATPILRAWRRPDPSWQLARRPQSTSQRLRLPEATCLW